MGSRRVLAVMVLMLVVAVGARRASAQEAEPDVPGWSRGGGIAGITISAGVLSLGTASELTRDHLAPSLALGISATLLLAVNVPIGYAGGVATRARTGVPGVPALRVIGWILYGLSLAGAGALVGLGAISKQPPSGLIAGVTSIGTSAGLAFSFDDFFVHAQARRKASLRTAFVHE